MKKKFRSAILFLFAVVFVRAAFADPAGELQKLMTKFSELKSFHHEYDDSKGMIISQDYVAPDRYRSLMSKAAGQPPFTGQLIIGDRIWMYSKGNWTKMPPFMSAMVQSFIQKIRGQIFAGQYVDMSSVKSLGTKIGKEGVLRGYSFNMKNNLGSETLWVNLRGFPVEGTIKTSSGGGTFTYSKFNQPIEISEP